MENGKTKEELLVDLYHMSVSFPCWIAQRSTTWRVHVDGIGRHGLLKGIIRN